MKEIPFDLEKAKAGEPILRNGRPARLIAHVPDAIETERVVVLQDGRLTVSRESGNHAAWHLTMVPKKYSFWLNLHHPDLRVTKWDSRDEADKYDPESRIACLRIEFTEGEGLEVKS